MVLYTGFYRFGNFQILSQNPNGLASDFTEKWQFTVETDPNSVFLDRKAQILDWLHIMVLYLNFYGVLKNQILDQNSKVLSFGFTAKRQFAAKTGQNSIFLGYKSQILDRLYIMVTYISFYGF
jgi:hypothetical protein